MEEKKKIGNAKLLIVAFVLTVAIIFGSTFAWFTLTKTSEKVNTIKAGSLSMELDDKASDGILLQKAIPMSYQQGMNTTNYEFTLTNNGSKGDYKISLIDEATYTDSEGAQVTIAADKKIADTKIRYILLKDGEVEEASKSMLLSEAANRVIDSGTIANGTTINYSLRIWIDSKAENEVMGQIFNARLQLDATQHQEQTAPVVIPFVPTYFEFGTPTTASTTDFATLGKNVFATLGSDGTTGGVCINDGGLFCIQTNDYDNSVAAIKEHFGESSCDDYGSSFIGCGSSAFFCGAASDGFVRCGDHSAGENCGARADGAFRCDL